MSTSASNPNFERLALAAQKLAPLLDRIAFVGGCVTGFLLTDPAAAEVRPTLDVDAIIAIASYAEFTHLENTLRGLGFRQFPVGGSPICRWKSDDLILDLMPTDSSILGFGNLWYGPTLENSEKINVGGLEIRVVSAPYFIATKLEAFHGRGKGDFRMSHDREDMVTVVDGRSELVDEVRASQRDLQDYLRRQFRALLLNRDFLEALPGHLLPDAASQQRLHLVVGRMQKLVEK